MTTQTLPPPAVDTTRTEYSVAGLDNSVFVGVVDDAVGTTVTVRTHRNSGRAEFRALADWWHEATGHLSSPDRIAAHVAYRRIVELGRHDPSILRYVLEDLRDRGGYWFGALREITGISVVQPEHRGKPRLMREDWLNWARTEKLIP